MTSDANPTDQPVAQPAQRAIDVVRASSVTNRRSIVVPEWKNMELFFGKITVSDMQAVNQREPKTPEERNLTLLIHKAQDRDGRPLFSMGDMHFLATEGDFVVLQRVWNFMFETAYTLDEAREELRKNPPPASV